jgi:hypothetical protein
LHRFEFGVSGSRSGVPKKKDYYDLLIHTLFIDFFHIWKEHTLYVPVLRVARSRSLGLRIDYLHAFYTAFVKMFSKVSYLQGTYSWFFKFGWSFGPKLLGHCVQDQGLAFIYIR